MAAQFGPAGGTIGRNEGNTLVLPDDAKTISRQQAQVLMQGGHYVLVDKGANPTLRNRVPVGSGQSVPLVAGDELRIGPYVLVVESPASSARGFDPQGTLVNEALAARPSAAPAVVPPPVQRPAALPPFDPFAIPPPAPAVPPAPLGEAAAGSPFSAAPTAPAPFSGAPTALAPLGGAPTAPAPFAATPAAPAPFGAPTPAMSDPFADLLGPTPAAPAAARPPVDPFGLPPSAPAPAARPTGSAIPDDFDPFASLSRMPPPASHTSTGGFNPLSSGARRIPPPIPFDSRAGHDDLIGPAVEKSASIDELFGLGAAPANPLDVLGAPAGAGNPSAQPVDDPLALFGGPSSSAGAGPAHADQTPAVHSAFALPQAAPAPRTAPTPMPVPSAPVPMPTLSSGPPGATRTGGVSAKAIDDLLASVGPLDPNKGATGQFRVAQPAHTAPLPPSPPASPAAAMAPAAAAGAPPVAGQVSVDALMTAFCEGLGSPLNLPDGVTEEFMFRMGGLVREAVQGTVDLLNARAVTKREVKASATMIMERNNNPLKFSPDAKTAMLYLVSGRLNPAFMPPITAMRDAYYDLRSHQFGFMAGTKAALEGVIERFEPQRLEGRLSKGGLVESIIPAARKARLWDLFTELYKEIAREAEDDFHALFGQAFLKAYEEHVEALRRDMPQE
ncbi:type VI secretion system-associated FHA domain protein TagH [Eleftheria terrae]|uniref:type VI secretion system-associated FHA domain protein TagH n=1 Tax=Eleftheria terrae TaxID=1597781 RepID=UPI00263B0936|nr:type VI secretion system-associated FHA domain protein TagH [Eleftheria terrae]WKB53775.1 type VI secretion system-associated FHA domain protein TagH [Eleftheria terrae]